MNSASLAESLPRSFSADRAAAHPGNTAGGLMGRLKIRTRMLLLVALSVVSLVLVGLFGLTQLRILNGSVVTITRNVLPGVQSVGAIQLSFEKLNTLIYRHIYSLDMKELKPLEAAIKQQQKDLSSNVEAYAKSVSGPEDKARYEELKTALAAYLKQFDLTFAASNTGDQQKAAQMAGTALQSTVDKARKPLDALLHYNLAMSESSQQTASSAYARALTGVIAATVVAALLLIVIGSWIYRGVLGPINQLRRSVTDVAEQLDFTRRVPVHGNDELAESVMALNSLLDVLQPNLQELAGAIDQVAQAAGGMRNTAQTLSDSADQQNEAASSMAAAVEELSVSISHVADQSGDANMLAQRSGELATSGGQVIQRTSESINRIATVVRDGSKQIEALKQQSVAISKVVQVIREIADQTNLLALNAAIEAARAGEQGRGFAVVADEVRKLAERTAQSTGEITRTIQTMQHEAETAVSLMSEAVGRVEEGVQQAQEASDSIEHIRAGSGDTVARVTEIASAIREQSEGAHSLSAQVEQVSMLSDNNTHAAHTTAHTAEELDRLSATMREMVGRYRV